jgi:hypothetical protein
MLTWFKNTLYRLHHTSTKDDIALLKLEIQELRRAVGALTAHVSDLRPDPERRQLLEFKVFSQFGDDGILHHLLNMIQLPEEEHSFIEFGVETFEESNCRFLMEHRNWRGLVMDASQENIAAINAHPSWWKFNLQAKTSFITRENINELFLSAGFHGKIGVLSVDLDGNDYWVWEAIDAINPAIVICEYNSRFGPTAPITIPYDPAFQRKKAHSSGAYWGASIQALHHLAEKKGYTTVAANQAGNNVYFVRNDFHFPKQDPSVLWREAQFREVRENDTLLHWNQQEIQLHLGQLPVENVILGITLPIKEALTA